MSRVYKGAVLVRTASVTTTDGIRIDLAHYRYTTNGDQAHVAHREWIRHTQYVGGTRTHDSAQVFTGRRLDRVDDEWDECVKAMREAGPVTVEQHSHDPRGSRWLGQSARHQMAPSSARCRQERSP